MTSKDNGGNGPSPPDRAGDDMNLLIGWRAGGTEAAGEPAAERNAEEAAEPGAEAVSVPAFDPAFVLARCPLRDPIRLMPGSGQDLAASARGHAHGFRLP